jgi:hypothetical protein
MNTKTVVTQIHKIAYTKQFEDFLIDRECDHIEWEQVSSPVHGQWLEITCTSNELFNLATEYAEFRSSELNSFGPNEK